MEEFDYRNANFDPSPSPELICSICHCVFYNPVESTCGHVFCKNCIEQWLTSERTCPKCRKILSASSLAKVSPVIRNIILSLKIQCPNKDLGCDELCTVEHYKFHLNTCPYLKMKCTNGDCVENILLKDKMKHEDLECLFYIVNCSVCKTPIIRHKLYDHNCFEELKKEVESQKRKIAELCDQNKLLQQQVREVNKKHLEILKGISMHPMENRSGECVETLSEIVPTQNQLKISEKKQLKFLPGDSLNSERNDHPCGTRSHFSIKMILGSSIFLCIVILLSYIS